MQSWFVSSMRSWKTWCWVEKEESCRCKISIYYQRVSSVKYVHNQLRLMRKVLLNSQRWSLNLSPKGQLVAQLSKEQLVNQKILNIVQHQEIYQHQALITTVFFYQEFHQKRLVVNILRKIFFIFVSLVNVNVSALNVSYMVILLINWR